MDIFDVQIQKCQILLSQRRTKVQVLPKSTTKFKVISESEKTCCITGVDNENAVLYKLPETIQGYKVVEIKTGAFGNCHRIKNIIFPNTLKKISYNCIPEYACDISSIYIPKSVEFIGRNFGGCKDLSSIIVDPENKYYDSRDNCNAIIETSTNKLVFGCYTTTIPNSITSIGPSAFYSCSKLKTIYIPNSVT